MKCPYWTIKEPEHQATLVGLLAVYLQLPGWEWCLKPLQNARFSGCMTCYNKHPRTTNNEQQ